MGNEYIVEFKKLLSLSGGYNVIRGYVENGRQIIEPTDDLGKLVLETAEEMFKRVQEKHGNEKFTFSVLLSQ